MDLLSETILGAGNGLRRDARADTLWIHAETREGLILPQTCLYTLPPLSWTRHNQSTSARLIRGWKWVMYSCLSVGVIKITRSIDDALALMTLPPGVERTAPRSDGWIAAMWQPKRIAHAGMFLAIVSIRSFLFNHWSAFLAKGPSDREIKINDSRHSSV